MVVQGENSTTESLAKLEKLMETMVECMSNMEIVIHNEFDVDGRAMARNTVKHINDMTIAAGKPVLLF